MQKIQNVTFKTKDKTIEVKEALDVGGNYYYIQKNKVVVVVKKNSDISVTFEKIKQDNDNSAYLNKKEVVFS